MFQKFWDSENDRDKLEWIWIQFFCFGVPVMGPQVGFHPKTSEESEHRAPGILLHNTSIFVDIQATSNFHLMEWEKVNIILFCCRSHSMFQHPAV
jgi:hypothetical protein